MRQYTLLKVIHASSHIALHSDEQDAGEFTGLMRIVREHLANHTRSVMVGAMLAVASSGVSECLWVSELDQEWTNSLSGFSSAWVTLSGSWLARVARRGTSFRRKVATRAIKAKIRTATKPF
jgi:hypothetical protein